MQVAGVAREASARHVPVVGITGRGADTKATPLGAASSHVVGYALPPSVSEPFGGAPTSSIVAQEAVANALVRALGVAAGFDAGEFKRNAVGRRARRVALSRRLI